jgi:hypothetical protein
MGPRGRETGIEAIFHRAPIAQEAVARNCQLPSPAGFQIAAKRLSSGDARTRPATATARGPLLPPGDFFIDPVRAVDRALITHGHSDHARSGHAHVLATRQTLDIMALRYGENFAGADAGAALGEPITINGVTVTFQPAGHVLGSAQILVEHGGMRIVASGDYKRRADPTCAPFEPIPCDVFITEATFGLPVFRHPPASEEIGRLLKPPSRSFPSAPISSAPMRSARRSASSA